MKQQTFLLLTEAQEGANLAEYLDVLQRTGKIMLYSHIPHETYTTSWAAKRRNKVQGVKPGVPDYVIVTKNEVLFIELKRSKKGIASTEQKEWLLQLNNKQTASALARGFEEAKKFINERV